MHTGDLAIIDSEDCCHIVGRCKDMIIRGGENIYPAEVEQHLYRHSAIAQVAVFGVPDATYGEIVCAWIVPRAGTIISVDLSVLSAARILRTSRRPRIFDSSSSCPPPSPANCRST